MLLVVDGVKAIKEYQKKYKRQLKEYKQEYGGWGYTFKKVKPKTAKKPYYYWYKWEYNPDTQNNEWTYIGKQKPLDEIPDPPQSELDTVNYTTAGSNILIDPTEYEKVKHLFEGYQTFQVNPS